MTRADVLALVCLTLLAGVAAQAYAQSDSMLSPTIAASDTPPTKTMSFVTGSRIASEGSGTHNVKVRLEPAPTTDITLKYTVGGTATAGSDFTIANSGTLSVPRGATTATIPLKIVDGSEFEVDAETVVLELIRSAGYHPVEGNRYGSRHTLTIADNDSPWHSGVPIVGISGGGTVTEGESISFTLTAEPTPKRDLWVKLQVDDFAANSGPNPNSYTVASERGYKDLIIPAGKNSAVYRVQTDDDDADDDRYSPGAGVIQVAISGFYGMRYRKHPWKPSVRGYVWDNDGSSTNSTPTVSFASASQSAGEGSGTHDVGVRLGKAPATDITLAYTVGGTATSGSDYTALSGTVTVPKDATTATIPVTLIDDSVPESSETIVLTLAAGSDYAVGSPDTHTLTIAANDPPTASFASASQSAGEGTGTHDVEVRLDKAPATDLTLAYTVDGTATSGSDYTALSGTVTVSAGATTATLPVTLIDDSAEEGSETVVLTLATGSDYEVGSPDTHTLTIAASDGPPRISFEPLEGRPDVNARTWWVKEGSGTHDVKVKLSPAPASDITVKYKVVGNATSGSDYTALSGTVTVPKGATTATIPVTIIDDNEPEYAEEIALWLLGSSGYELTRPFTHHIIIDPSDGPPWVSLVPALQSAGEGSGTHDVGVRLGPAPAADIAFAYTVTGTATSGSDYKALSGSVTVSRGTTTATIPVTLIDDSLKEGSETIVLKLTGSAGYKVTSPGTHTLTVLDDETPTMSFASASQSVDEGSGTHDVEVRLDPAPTSEITLSYTVDGTATSGSDYTALSGTLSVPKGATTATVPVAVIDDSVHENGETVVLTLTAGSGYAVASPGVHTLSIADDDPAPPPGVDAALVAQVRGYAAETHQGQEHVDRWKRVLAAFGDDNGYTAMTAAEAQVFADKGWQRWVPVVAALEALEAAQQPLTLPAVSVSAGADVTEGGDAVFTVTASPAPAAELSVTVTVAAEGDFGVTAGSRTVPIPTAGSATLTLTTTGDDTDEPDGSVSVTVAAGEGYTIGDPASGSVAIADDDPTPTTAAVDPALIAQVRGYAAETWKHPEHVDRWRRVLAAFGDDNGYTAMTAAEAQTYADRGWQRWVPVVDALAALEAAPEPDPVTVPAVSVSAGADVTEGGDAVFTVTASPAPAADLAVSVDIAADGAYGITAGKRTVTIPTAGSATLTLATTNDDTDEPDGSVTATVAAGEGYTVGAPASGSVSIQDDDEPPPAEPAVTIAAGASPVTEGGDATFTLTASPAPASPLTVSVTVAVDGAYGITAGKQTVTIPTAGSATLTLATTNDDTDEPDGSVTVTLNDGEGYTVGAPASDTLSIEDDDLPPPVVTVTASTAPVTEGGDAVFTVSASRAPDADLAVTLEVADAPDSDFVAGGDEGARTVTIPDGATSVVFTLATANDATDEPDGVVTVTLKAGEGYTVGAPASDTLSIEDDDLPPPVVSIAAKAASVTEGGAATFTLTADRAPAADLTVTLAVSETGDHVAAETEGAATAVIARGETQAAFSVATVNDDADEPDGVVTVTLKAGEGYTVASSQGAATVTVSDDDAAPGPVLSVDDVTVTEGAWMEFTVRLSAPSAGGVSVKVSTRDSTPVSATARDYWPLSGKTVSFRAGETERSVGVIVYDDSHDEGSETFEVVLSDARGAPIGDGVAVGTIVNDDPMPAAWLGRFGRTVAEQALDGIAGRLAAPRTPGMQGAIAGQALTFGATSGDNIGPDYPPAGSPNLGGTGSRALSEAVRGFAGHDAAGLGNGPGALSPGGAGATQSHVLTAREALLGSSFTLTGAADATGGSMALWGRGSQGRFDGREGTFSLDGEVTTGMLGADYARGKWLVGLALAQSAGEGEYHDTKVSPRPASQTCPPDAQGVDTELCRNAVRAGDGTVEASLTAAIPYASLHASERLTLWGAVGTGSGEVTLDTTLGGSYKSDTTWRMAAAGFRGALLTPPTEGSGPALAVTSDALWTRTASEKTHDLAASESDATRLRLGVEGSYRMALEGGGHLAPKLEVGARHDGGDAETGFGIELGGGIAWSAPALGLSLDVSGRTLLSHEDDDLKDRGYAAALGFDPSPGSERGPSFSLRQEFGARADGGLDALFAPAPLEDRTDSEAASRWSLEAAYGVPAFGGRWTASPHVGLGLSAAARDYSLGWRWTPARSAPDLTFGMKATRRESDTAAPEHSVGVEARAMW